MNEKGFVKKCIFANRKKELRKKLQKMFHQGVHLLPIELFSVQEIEVHLQTAAC